MVYLNEITLQSKDKAAFGEILTAGMYIQGILSQCYGTTLNTWNSFGLYAGSASTSASTNIITLTSGTSGSSQGITGSRGAAAYIPGIGITWRGSVLWPSGGRPAQASQISIAGMGGANYAAVGAPENGWFMGYDGLNGFGVCRIVDGTRTWVYQANFNVDQLGGSGPSGITLNQGYWNVFQIKTAWLGYAATDYSILGSDNQWYLFHRTSYVNTAIITPSVLRPYFRSMFYVSNAVGFTNAVNIATTSSMVGLNGLPVEPSGLDFAYAQATRTIQAENSLVGIQVATTFKSANNYIPIRINAISVSSDGTKNVLIRVLINPTYTTPGTYVTSADPVTGWSVVNYDNAPATTYSANSGRLVFSFTLAKTDQQTINLREYEIRLFPGERMHVNAYSVANSDCQASISWSEDQ